MLGVLSGRQGVGWLVLQTQLGVCSCGMTQKQLNRLFKVFETIKMNSAQGYTDKRDALSRRGTTSGFGLGLYLSLELVRFLKGDIKVESDLDQGRKGTKVTITFQVEVNQNKQTTEDKLITTEDNVRCLEDKLKTTEDKLKTTEDRLRTAEAKLDRIEASRDNENQNAKKTGEQLTFSHAFMTLLYYVVSLTLRI